MGVNTCKHIGRVYCVTNKVNGKRYVGVARNPELRLKSHIKGHSDAAPLLHEAIVEFGVENFTLETVFTGPYMQALQKEKYFIKKLHTRAPSGYNKSSGGEVFNRIGQKASPETRAKLSALNKGSKHPMWGRKHSLETRAKLSAAKKGNKYAQGHILTFESRAKLSAAMKGRKHSLKTRAKISAAGKGRKLSYETRANMRVAWARRKSQL